MKETITQQELEQLENYFRELEENSIVPKHSAEDFLCVRLDGIKMSTNLLKSKLIDSQFTNALNNSVQTVYRLFRNFGSEKNNFFLCALAISDEVSFVLNSGENRYENRPLKISTVFSGTLSSALTIQRGIKKEIKNKKPEYPKVVAFDARPLVLSDFENIEKYIRCRWIQGYRNLMCKILRLEKILTPEEIFETELKNNIIQLQIEIEKNGLERRLNMALEKFLFYRVNNENHFEKVPIRTLRELKMVVTDLGEK